MNLEQVKDKTIKLINNYSNSGNLISKNDPNYLDYSLRFNSLIDIAQKEIATVKKIHRVKNISQNPVPNLLENPLYQFDVEQHLDEDLTFEAKQGKAYYFEIDNVADVYVEEYDNGWQVLEHISHTDPKGEYTAYKGLINAYGKVRLRFSGDYVYNIKNRAIYGYSFLTDDDVPPFTRFNRYFMPDDFYQLNKVVFDGNWRESKTYHTTADFFWEQRNVIALNYYNVGAYSIFYFAYPKSIDDDTLDDYELEIDMEAQEAIPYYVAAHVLMDETSLYTTLLAMYNNKLANLDDRTANAPKAVENTMYSSQDIRTF
ncbi:MAG: hypothetical protein M0P77_10290 [Firmicutes bacterium]|nr:hypothetical protein [Bacillota bacterium]